MWQVCASCRFFMSASYTQVWNVSPYCDSLGIVRGEVAEVRQTSQNVQYQLQASLAGMLVLDLNWWTYF